MDTKIQHMHNAAKLLRSQHSGVLSTVSLSLKGFPFGSITPFLMTENGDIVIYASDIAQHSRNMQTNDKVSLCVYDGQQDDSQASARVTIVGNAIVDKVSEELQEHYMSVFPQAKAYVKAHDFRFYLISTYKVRYIGGFGEIYWFSTQEWQSLMYSLAGTAKGAIIHMHEDHGDALAQIVSHEIDHELEEGAVNMVSCFQHGFHFYLEEGFSTKDKRNIKDGYVGFVPFISPISNDYTLRDAMVELTKLSGASAPELSQTVASVA